MGYGWKKQHLHLQWGSIHNSPECSCVMGNALQYSSIHKAAHGQVITNNKNTLSLFIVLNRINSGRSPVMHQLRYIQAKSQFCGWQPKHITKLDPPHMPFSHFLCFVYGVLLLNLLCFVSFHSPNHCLPFFQFFRPVQLYGSPLGTKKNGVFAYEMVFI